MQFAILDFNSKRNRQIIQRVPFPSAPREHEHKPYFSSTHTGKSLQGKQ